jgi:hypothetical protein
MGATKMDSVAAPEVFRCKRGNSYRGGLQLLQGLFKPMEILGGGEYGNIGVSAKFGSAVQYARLTADKQALDMVRGE